MTTPDHRDKMPDIPDPVVVQRTRWTASLVWAIPILAALIGLSLVINLVLDRGPGITIRFKTAEGLEAGKTKVKYKDVDIGEVKAITLSKDLGHVLVNAELVKGTERFAVADTRFWVVRPRVAASGVSGLGTLFSGAYIGADAGQSSEKQKEFIGVEGPPIVTTDLAGRQFILHADDGGSLDIGVPVYYHHIQVGQVVASDLDQEGRGVTFKIFVQAPYDRFVTPETRFWDTSGVDVRIDASGVKVKTRSLASLLLGGIAFDVLPGSATTTPAKENTVYVLAADQEQAMKQQNEKAELTILYFDQSIRGLGPGAPVDFRGLVLGNVKSIGVEFDPELKEFRMPVTIAVYLERLGEQYRETILKGQPTARTSLLEVMVKRGFRAQLRTDNLLTGQLYVALDFFPHAFPVLFDPNRTPPEIPTVASGIEDLQSQLAEIAQKLNKVPFDSIATNLNKNLIGLNSMLRNAEKLFRQINQEVTPEAKAALAEARKAFTAAQHTLSQDAPLVHDTRQAVQELTRTAQSLRVLADYLERHPESLLRGK
jgi:paraquat-inducible protein B